MMRGLLRGGVVAQFLGFLILFSPLCPWGEGFWGPQTGFAACEGDFFGDGDVDGSDLSVIVEAYGGGVLTEGDLSAIALSFGRTGCTVEPLTIQFKEVRSGVEEGVSAQVVLLMSRSYSGQISLQTYGTSLALDHGLGCSGVDCSASVTGISEAIFAVPVVDDTIMEEMEWLGLRLVPTPPYQVGAVGEHVISIEDNDAVWEGIFTSSGEELGFSIEILRSGSGVTAKVLGEGGGVIPAGVRSLNPDGISFPLTFNLGSKTFSGTLPAVPLPSGSTLLGTDGTLQLELQANEATGGVSQYQVQGMSDLGSSTQMRIDYPGASHMNSVVAGSFVLLRRPAKPSTAEVPLEPSN